MAAFDFIDAAGHGYKTIWKERSYLMGLAALPILVSLLCHLALMLSGWDQYIFRQALVLLPSFFANGWMVSHLSRLIFLGQRWPFRPSGNETKDIAALEDRARGIVSGTLTFVLINFIMIGAIGFYQLLTKDYTPPPGGPENLPLIYYISAIGMMLALIWLFRLVWLYIPVAIGYPLRRFMRDISGIATSFYLVATWIIGYIPAIFLFFNISASVLEPYSEGAAADLPFMVELFMAIFSVLVDTIVLLITTAGIAYAFRNIIGTNKPTNKGKSE